MSYLHETVELSHVWDEALEQLANLPNMTNALQQRRDEAIARIKGQPHQWKNDYLPKLREFVRLTFT
jgi:hypothetical protein